MPLFNAWIDPKGKIHRVGCMGHAEFLFEYLRRIKDRTLHKTNKYRDDPSEYFFEKGWKKIQQWSEGVEVELYPERCKLFTCTIKEIRRICEEEEMELPSFLKYGGLNHEGRTEISKL